MDRLALHIDEARAFMEGFVRPSLQGAAPEPFPRRRLAVGNAAMAVLPVLLVAAFLLPDLAFVIRTAGIVFIVLVAAFEAYSMRARRPAA